MYIIVRFFSKIPRTNVHIHKKENHLFQIAWDYVEFGSYSDSKISLINKTAHIVKIQ